jgi:hypothetical protein
MPSIQTDRQSANGRATRNDARQSPSTLAELLDSVPPHSLDDELGALASAMLDSQRLAEVRAVLEHGDFYRDANNIIYRHLLEMDAAGEHVPGQPVDITLLVGRLKDADELESAGGLSYLGEVAGGVAISTHAAHYAARVRAFADQRREIEALRERLQQAYAEIPAPIMLDRLGPPAWKPYPVDVLPEVLRDYATEAAGAIGCDVALLANATLPVVAAAIGASRRIAMTRDYFEPSIIWATNVGESGQHKTPALNHAKWPLDEIQARDAEAHKAALAEYEKQVQQHEAEVSGRKRGEPKPAAPERPRMRQCIADDSTMEGLLKILKHCHRGVLVARDELRAWFESHDAYRSGGRGGDSAKWLSMFNGQPVTINRAKDDDPTFIRRACVSLVGGIQPAILRRAFSREKFEDGTVARLLLAYPPPRPLHWSGRSIPVKVKARYGDAIARLRLLPMNGIDDALEPIDLPITPEGAALWRAWFNERGEEQARLTGDDAAAGAKLLAYGARFALIFHLVRVVTQDSTIDTPDAVDAASIAAGTALADWYRHEARRVYAVLKESDDASERRKVVDLVRERGGRITARNLATFHRPFRGRTAAAEECLSALVRAGAGRWEWLRQDRGGRPTREFVLAKNATLVCKTPAKPEGNGGLGFADTRDTETDTHPQGVSEEEAIWTG